MITLNEAINYERYSNGREKLMKLHTYTYAVLALNHFRSALHSTNVWDVIGYCNNRKEARAVVNQYGREHPWHHYQMEKISTNEQYEL